MKFKKKEEEEEAYPLSPRIMTFNNMRRRDAMLPENQNRSLSLWNWKKREGKLETQ